MQRKWNNRVVRTARSAASSPTEDIPERYRNSLAVRASKSTRVPTEDSEQEQLAYTLDRTPGLVWCAVPNAGKRSPQLGALLKRTGLKPGFPDCIVFTRPPARPTCEGTIFEMKRSNGTFADVSPQQREWLSLLDSMGWATFVGYGRDDALKKLVELGYPISQAVMQSILDAEK